MPKPFFSQERKIISIGKKDKTPPSSVLEKKGILAGTQLEFCQKNVTATLGIDNQKIETCAAGSEGIALLSADEAIMKNLKITGSPTLIMNGQRYVGQRTAEAYKQTICTRFETSPAECSVNLSAPAVADSTGSC